MASQPHMYLIVLAIVRDTGLVSSLTDRVIGKFGPEDVEQYAAVQYLDQLASLYNLKYTSVPNSTYTKSPMQRMRNALLGLHPGLGDLFIVWPEHWVLSVEMKRAHVKGGTRGVLSAEQQAWITALQTVPNVEAVKCEGFVEFVALMKSLLPNCPEPHPMIVPLTPAIRTRVKQSVDTLPF